MNIRNNYALVVFAVALLLQHPTVSAAYLRSQTPAPQQSGPVYKLSKQELESWATFESAPQAYNQTVNQIVNAAAQLPLEPANSTRIHAELREAMISLSLSQTQRQSFLWQLRARHKCDNCEIQNGELRTPAK